MSQAQVVDDILRTPAPGCQDCEARRLHSKENWAKYHPLAGHGYLREKGWTYDQDTGKPFVK
jgi:hypothetical protein